MHTLDVCLVAVCRAAKRAEGVLDFKKLSLVKRAKNFPTNIIHGRCGQSINGIGSTCLHISKYNVH